LPIVSPDVPDIARIVNGRNLGVMVPRHEAAAWAEAIQTALANEQTMRINALAAATELVWEELADDLLAAYDHPSSVTIISFADLTTHQRTLRMIDTLTKRGVRVTICCPQTEAAEPAPSVPGVRYVFTPRGVTMPEPPAADVGTG
jgi:UDP:flavonoid glycosyltransferase YjiC (YdhE family)